MKTRTQLYGLIATFMLSASISALAEPRGMMGDPPDGGMMGPPPDGAPPPPDAMPGPERMAEKLGLSKDQVTKLQAVRQKYVDELKAKREGLQAAHAKLRELLTSDKSVTELKAQHELLKTLKSEIDDLHFSIMLETRELLTPEQRTKFAGFMDKQMKKGAGHHNHGDGPAAAK